MDPRNRQAVRLLAMERGKLDWDALATRIVAWGRELGFGAVGIADTDLGAEEARLVNWLAAGRHGAMGFREPSASSRRASITSLRAHAIPPSCSPTARAPTCLATPSVATTTR